MATKRKANTPTDWKDSDITPPNKQRELELNLQIESQSTISNIPSPDNKCISNLLLLPGEIRNLIYKLSLSHESGAVIRNGWDGKGRLCYPSTYQAINQLKAVNKQLRTETLDLEIRYNDLLCEGVVIGEATIKTPVMQCTSFFHHLHHSQHQYLRKITLKQDHAPETTKGFSKKALKQVYQFCSSNSRTSVHIRLPYLSQRVPEPYFNFAAHSTAMAARGCAEFARHISVDMYIYDVDENPLVGQFPIPTPSNVRFFPYEDQLDELLCRRACMASDFLKEIFWDLAESDRNTEEEGNDAAERSDARLLRGLDMWVGMAKEIFEKGI